MAIEKEKPLAPTILEDPTGQLVGVKDFLFTKDWWFYSVVLGQWSMIPKGFLCDLESVPLLRGTSRKAGCAHDYLSRKDSDPVVTKKVAADVYLEFMLHFGAPAWKAYGKYWTVRTWLGYFHKKTVLEGK